MFDKIRGEHQHVLLIVGVSLILFLLANDTFWFTIKAYLFIRLLKFLFIVSKSFVVHFLTPEYDLSPLKNSWTVVTGGTDGIGQAYIKEMARSRGIRKFFLIGRNEKKLQKVAGEMQANFGAEVKTAVFDFESDDYSKLTAELSNMDIGILINCAGIAPSSVGNMMQLESGLPSKILKVNLMSNIKMNEIVLPGMIARDRGIIVNVSSMTGWRPLPYISSYPASKAAISFFSDAMSDEFRHTNVRIQCLVPLLVATKVASYDASEANNLFVVSTENFAKQAVRAIGQWELLTGCMEHDLNIAFGTLVSFFVFKALFVPLVMLGIHQKRVAEYQRTHQ